MNIVKTLQYNKHPKSVHDYSLVDAVGWKVSDDGTTLVLDDSIIPIKNLSEYNILGVIPCPYEFILILKSKKDSPSGVFFYRYGKDIVGTEIDELIDDIILPVEDGEYNGTYSYNINNELIIALGNSNPTAPLRVINFGLAGSDVYTGDRGKNIANISVLPEIELPKVNSVEIIKGSAYKGVYELFIRFKYNNYDYSNWISIGPNIILDSLSLQKVFEYKQAQYCIFNKQSGDTNYRGGITWPMDKEIGADTDRGFTMSPVIFDASDFFGTNKEIIDKTIKINFDFSNRITSIFQLGCIIRTNNANRCLRTEDIISNNTTSYIINLSDMVEHDINDMTIENMNILGVKNITTFQNRLYISNYYEKLINEQECLDLVNNIDVSLTKKELCSSQDIKYVVSIFKSGYEGNKGDNQDGGSVFYINTPGQITFKEYFNLSNENPNDLIYFSFNYNGKVYTANDYLKTINVNINRYTSLEANYKDIKYGVLGLKQANNSDVVEYTGKIKITYKNREYILDDNLYMSSAEEIIHSNNTFNERCIGSTLMPGEVYNFYIHFYDKYGKYTDGIKLTPKLYSINSETSDIYIPISFVTSSGEYYFAVTKNTKLSTFINNLRSNSNRIFRTCLTNNLSNEITDSSQKEELSQEFLDRLYIQDETILNMYACQVLYSGSVTYNQFGIFVNNQNDIFFRIPNYNYTVNKYNVDPFNRYLLNINNVQFPENAKGYIITYEKFEPIKYYRGILTNKDFNVTIQSTFNDMNVNPSVVKLITPNNELSSYSYFYSDEIDIKTSLSLKCNLMFIKHVGALKDDTKEVSYRGFDNNHENIFNYNKPFYDIRDYKTIYSTIDSLELCVANDGTTNRIGKGSAFKISGCEFLFKNEKEFEDYNHLPIYICDLLYINPNIYSNYNKNLIRLSEHIKDTSNQIIDIGNYNGHYTYSGVLCYNANGAYLDETTNKFKKFNVFNNHRMTVQGIKNNPNYYLTVVSFNSDLNFNDSNLIADKNEQPICAYLQYLNCDTYMHECKEFNNPPKNYIGTFVQGKTDEKPEDTESYCYYSFSTVIPQDTIDLFKNNFDDINQPYKLFINYDIENKYNNNIFNKTIRRSLVFTDEGLNNNWKIFKPEAYKMLDSNKGIITNLASIGNVFLVHTNQTLFQVSNDNTLKANNTELAFAAIDIFDIDFQEVFTSALGFAGLKKSSDAILNEFGYIFYDAYNKAIYQYDSGQIKNIDIDISYWIKNKCDGIQFGFDKLNSRLFIQIIKELQDGHGFNNPDNIYFNDCLSYDLRTQSFISRHPIRFDKAFNTKDNLYFVDSSSIISKIERTDNYGIIPLSLLNKVNIRYIDYNTTPQINSIDTCSVDPKINIIINTEYEVIKYIEYITYKIRKIIKGYIDTFNPSDGNKGSVKIYPGDKLRIYNDLIDTGEIDISQSEDNFNNIDIKPIFKPYYDLGNWNINTLKNNIIGYNTKKDDELSRLYGNYFVIEFKFKNIDLNQIEFESISANLTSNRI